MAIMLAGLGIFVVVSFMNKYSKCYERNNKRGVSFLLSFVAFLLCIVGGFVTTLGVVYSLDKYARFFYQ